MRVGVTGSRNWTDEVVISRALTAAAARAIRVIRVGSTRLVVVHGTAKGADTLADEWVRRWSDSSALQVTAERHPANWAHHHGQAGYLRNAAMIRRGAALWLAFLMPCDKPGCDRPQPHDSHGATHCAEVAADAGIPLHVYRPGQPVLEFNVVEPDPFEVA